MFNESTNPPPHKRYVAWLTCILAAIALLAQTNDDIGQCLAYDRTAIIAGEVWRLVTGHLTHWNADHLFWDIAMFMILGVIVERRNARHFAGLLAAAALAISAVLWFCHPAIVQYRGLSGIDSALFTYAAIMLSVEARQARRPALSRLILVSLAGFASKVGYEFVTGSTLFVSSSEAGFSPLASAHLIGGLVGAVGASASALRHSHRPVVQSTRIAAPVGSAVWTS